MTNLPKVHPREQVVAQARLEIMTAIVEAAEPLTDGERLHVLTEIFTSEIRTLAKIMIVQERGVW